LADRICHLSLRGFLEELVDLVEDLLVLALASAFASSA